MNVLRTLITMGNHAVIYPFLNDKIAFFVLFKYAVHQRMVQIVEMGKIKLSVHAVPVQKVSFALIKNASEFRKKL